MEHVNTLKAYKDLMASGMPEIQAEAQVNLLNNSLDHMATKDDLKNLEKDLTKEMRAVEQDLTKELTHLRRTIYAVGAICALPVLERLLNLVK